MRIDSIDLIGDFLLRGNTGSNGQFLGVTGGQINWVYSSGGGFGAGPQGYQGITGPQGTGGGSTGTQGNTGSQGDLGPQGNTGSQGDLGPQGNTGSQGDLGPQGNSGSQGDLGPQGNSGSQGDLGPQGNTGSQGDLGPQGSQGNTGPGFTTIYNYAATRILTASGSNSANAESNLTFDGSILSLHNTQVQDVLNIDFYTGSTAVPKGGRLFYDYTEEALAYYSDGLNSPVHIGRELALRAYNVTGFTISVGQAVHVISATNGIPTVKLSISSSDLNANVNGVAGEEIPDGQIGLITTNGIITGVDTSSLILATVSPGDVLYLSDKVAGKYDTDYFGLSYSSRATVVGYVIATGSNGTIYVSTLNENLNLNITDRQRNVLEGNVISTGVFSFPAPGITISSTTTLNISEMKGWLVDNAGPITSTNPTVKLVEYPGGTGITLSNLTTATETYFLVDQNGLLTQQTTFPTPRQRRENIYIGKAGHANKSTIANAFPEPDVEMSPISQIRDMFSPIKLINDGIYPSYVGSNLTFQTSAGTLWGLGIGYTTDVLNPSSISIPGYSPTTFQYRLRSGGTYSNTTLIDPGFWDNAGVRTAIGTPTKQATNQRIFLIQNGIFRVQYGQTKYTDLATALASVQSEIFDTFVNFRDNGILIGVLSVVSNATNLSDPAQAKFLLVSKFGETVGAAGGLSTTTLQQAYNNSSEPEIITNATLDGVTFRRGTAADTDNVFVVQNGSASNTFYVRGDGNTWATSLHLTNIGLTSGASKYMVVNDSGDVFYQTTIVGGGGSTGPAGPTGAGGALGYYGSFYDTTDQLNPTASIARPMTINSTYESNGVSIVDGSKMTFDYPGTYNIQFSTVFTKSNSSPGTADIWFAKNGQYITASNTSFSIAGLSDQISSWNFMLTLNSNDYVELYWSSDQTTISILSTGTQSDPIRPSVPSVILTAQQVMYTQLGPTGGQGETGTQGPSNTTPIDINQIAFGTGNGITSSSLFQVSVGTYDTNTLTDSIASSVIGGTNNDVATSSNTSIIGGNQNNITNSTGSIILGSNKSNIDYSNLSIILGGAKSNINTSSSLSSIIGGNINTIIYSEGSSIIGGYNSIISTSSCSSIIGGSGNIMDNYSSGSVILGGIGLTLSGEIEVVYVPKLKIATASNINADRILVWDTADNYVKYRDVSSIGGAVGQFFFTPTAPGITGLTAGARWFDSITGEELVLVDDGNSVQWVQPQNAGFFGPQGFQGVIGVQGTFGPTGIQGIFGPTGIQGNTGPQGSGFTLITVDEIAFGTGTGVTSSDDLIFKNTNSTLIFGGYGYYNSISSGSHHSSIITGNCNCICAGANSNIIGGYKNILGSKISGVESSVIISGRFSRNYSAYSSIFSSQRGYLEGIDSKYNSIISGYNSLVTNKSQFSSIINSKNSTITNYGGNEFGLYGSKYSSIIGSRSNTFQKSFYSVSLAESGGLIRNSCYVSKIGTTGSSICDSRNSVILGGSGLTLSSENEVVYVPKLKIATVDNVDADRILVWDTDNYVKYRDVSTIGGGGGSSITILSTGLDVDVAGTMSSSLGVYKVNDTQYESYRINATITGLTGSNFYINYIGTVTITGTTFQPRSTQGLVDSEDPTGFIQTQSALTTGALVYDQTLGYVVPVDLMLVNYDNTTSPTDYDIYFIAGNTNNFSCKVFVDYLFYVDKNDTITFTN